MRTLSIILRHNETLELNLIEYRGAITFEQLKAVAAYGARNPIALTCDSLQVVAEDADFTSIDPHALDLLFLRYTKLYARFDLQIYRRSAWICHSPGAQSYVDHWIYGRDLKAGLSSTVRKFDSLVEACDWLLLNSDDAAAIARGEGFAEIARFDATEPAVAPAR